MNQKTSHVITESKGRNGSIDLFRLIVAIAIVMIHFGSQVKIYSPIYNTLGRMGVPFFFIVTGYYYFSRNIDSEWNFKQYSKYMSKTLTLWLFWTIIFFPRIFYLKNTTTPFSIIRSLFGLDITCGPLWYLIAAVEGLALVHLVYQRFGKQILIITVSISFVLCALASSYNGLISDKTILWILVAFAPQTSVVAAFFWFGISLLMVKFQNKFPTNRLAPLLVVFTFFWAIETFVVHGFHLVYSTDMSLFLVPVSVLFFLLLIRFPHQISIKTDRLLLDLSLYLYILQMVSGDLVNLWYRHNGVFHPEFQLQYFWIVLMVDFILSFGIIELKKIFKIVRVAS